MQVAYYMYFTPRKMKVENGKSPKKRRMRGRGSFGTSANCQQRVAASAYFCEA